MHTTTAAVPTSYRVMSPRPFIAAVLLLCLASSTSLVQAQQPATSLGPVDLDRIREELSRPPSPIFEVDVPADYRVRIETDEDDLRLKLAWIYDDSVTPGYIRPWYPIYHFEMQRMLLPRDFTAHLYPVGVPAGDAIRAFGDALRERRERSARERVRQEAEALRRAAEAQRMSPGATPPDR